MSKPHFVYGRLDARAVSRMLDTGSRIYETAAASALNKSLAKVRTKVVRETAARAEITPARLIRNRTKLRRARRTFLQAALAILITPVNAIRLANARQTETGSSAGKHTWDRAFIAVGLGDQRLIFRRKGSPRLPLEVMKVPISATAEQVLEAHLGEASAHLAEILPRELAWRMNNAR